MIAFVLSGGGNLGAMQIGALEALMRKAIRPELLVGTSAGAVNAAYLATNPTLEGVRQLAHIWKHMKKDNIYPGGPLRMAWHMAIHQSSLCTRKNFVSFLQRCTPGGIRCFQDLRIPLYIVATDLLTGRSYLFGEDPNEHVIDAILASTSIPPLFPPWFYRGRLLVDGGVSDNLPIGVAVEKGANQIFALDILRDGPVDDGHWNVVEVATLSLMDLIAQQRNRDLSMYSTIPGITLHYLPLYASRRLAFDDFRHAAQLIEDGRKAAEAFLREDYYLESPGKLHVTQKSMSCILAQTKALLGTVVSHFHSKSIS